MPWGFPPKGWKPEQQIHVPIFHKSSVLEGAGSSADTKHHGIGIAAHVLLEVHPSVSFQGSNQPHSSILFVDNVLSKKWHFSLFTRKIVLQSVCQNPALQLSVFAG